ncbi:MAG: hypothetical protein L3J95_05085 [Thermoplasmata archaeon]|nr:hypothetical protein [Thermoplasmata archaeon]MCI4359775.1 hypothetical protein [Thermoplasmata archaeon]
MSISSGEELVLTQARIAELEQTILAARHRFSGSPHARENLAGLYQHQLRELQHEVDEFLGVSGLPAGALELGFETKDGASGVTTLSALGEAVNSLRGAITSIAETLLEGTVREIGRPKADIARAVDLRVVGVSPGSFNLELEYPALPAEAGEGMRDLAERSLQALEDGLRWVDSEANQPPASLEAENLRKVVLSGVRKLSPTPAGPVSWVQLRRVSPLRLPPVRATTETLRKANAIAERSLKPEAKRVVGHLREIDLDKHTFEVSGEEGKRTVCTIDAAQQEEALVHIASQRLVMVTGTVEKKRLHVETLEPVRDAT